MITAVSPKLLSTNQLLNLGMRGDMSRKTEDSDPSAHEVGGPATGRGSMSTDQLEPISPAEAVELYLSDRAPEVSDKTLQNQRYRLDNFLEWCEEAGELDDLTQLTGRDLHLYRQWRGEQIKTVTLNGELQTLRVFLGFAADINAVEPGLRERVRMPQVNPEEEAADELLESDRQTAILDHLEKFRYASRTHVVMAVLSHTGIRLGSLRAFDVDDFNPDEPCLDLGHRPDTGTPLKNGYAAERATALGDYYCTVVADYIKHNREPVTDEHGHAPLITSRQGRLSETAIRTEVYQATRPCEIGECPHDRDPGRAKLCNTGRKANARRRDRPTVSGEGRLRNISARAPLRRSLPSG